MSRLDVHSEIPRDYNHDNHHANNVEDIHLLSPHGARWKRPQTRSIDRLFTGGNRSPFQGSTHMHRHLFGYYSGRDRTGPAAGRADTLHDDR
jgi:hypothetical protein